jgi:dipeptidyl aminopeptidase/acylaminoacyl peptidase
MRSARRIACLLLAGALGLWGVGRAAAPGGPLTVEDLVRLKRVSDPQISPDGRLLVFVQRETDMEANKARTSLWLLDLAEANPSPRRITAAAASDSSPRWAPDSRTLYFLSGRSGTSQVWRMDLPATAVRQVSDYPLDVGSLKVSPRGDRVAVSMEVFPECATLVCTKERLEKPAKEKSTGRTYERLFVRHWDAWSDGTRAHLFTAPLTDKGLGDPVELARGFDADTPSKPFGGDEDYSFSPDGTRLVFSARIAGRTEPWSTNFDLYEVPADGSAAAVDITASNPAWDAQPVFLANGDLAWLAQQRPGFESDRFHIVLREARSGLVRSLTGGWDRSVVRLAASRDGRTLVVSADENGQRSLFTVNPKTGATRRIVGDGEVEDFTASQEHVLLVHSSLAGPADLYAVSFNGGPLRRLTAVNAAELGARHLSEFEQFSFSGWHEETVHGYVMKPYGFVAGQRYPIAFLVHGGPQSSMQNIWTYRWNAQAFAGAGYAVVMIDFHGSPGYGQAFTDSISHDWGGKPLVDLQKGLAAAIGRYRWLDGERACALGASYGGFMMNWIEGNWPDRFRCIVNHDGLFDQRMMYYATEEIWFPEWEFGGPQYLNPQAYEAVNPVDFVDKWRTPMLVIHGQRDFRIPYTQGLGAFTALQRRGIESKLLLFADENHWVLKPANSVQWYHTVLGWLDAHLKN